MSIGEAVAAGSLLVAIPVAFAAGTVSFLSPCVLPLVPGYLSYITGLTGAQLDMSTQRSASVSVASTNVPAAEPTATESIATESIPAAASDVSVAEVRARVLIGTTLFIAGFTAVFVSFGALFGGLGATLLDHRDAISRVLGVIVIVFGLGFLGLIPALQRQRRVNPGASVRWGLAGAPVLGVTFGLGWVPCIGPTLAVVLSLSAIEASAGRGAILATAYCLGLGLPFLLVGLAFGQSTVAMAWLRARLGIITKIGGGLLVLIGVLLVLGLWDDIIRAAAGLLPGFTPAL